ncbi:hypothetical protein F5884DRAFT_26211 [Xylogone sp. PMI_703]|nr:hypothetical protein F5884DRAFT_26211 [Xylogone sp. PMI_703]
MSSAIVPTGGGNFQQSGQLDWVSLSKSTFTFGLDVLVRLSKAKLDPATMAIGLITCNRFVLKAEAQKRIQPQILLVLWKTHLVWVRNKAYRKGSCRNRARDGMRRFVCMHVHSYDSFYVAEVLRELCKLQEAPQHVIPSIHQWKVLVNICAGTISNSKFPTFLEGLIRLVLPGIGVSFQRPTPREALAKAIGALADVSNDKLACITIAGGLDCIWLAAISEWLLELDVEIRLDSGSTVYRSSMNNRGCFPAVTIIFVSDNEPSIQLSKCHVVPAGLKFLGIPDSDQPRFRGGRSEWENILTDTFGLHMNRLLAGTLQHSFALLLIDASRLAERSYRYGLMQNSEELNSRHCFPFSRFNFSRTSSRGQGYLNFAIKHIPELASTIHMLEQVEIQNYTYASWKESINRIALECTCDQCRGTESIEDIYLSQLCLQLIAETIIIFLWMLSVMDVDPSIKPSAFGLHLLYKMHKWKSQRARDIRTKQKSWNDIQVAYFPTNDVDILTAALTVFSGSNNDGGRVGKEPSALYHDGICVYFKAFEDLNLSPEEASVIRVVAGHINFEGVKYERIYDPVADTQISKGVAVDHKFLTTLSSKRPHNTALLLQPTDSRSTKAPVNMC